MSFTLLEIAEKIGAKIHGKSDDLIHGIAPLSSADVGQVSFLINKTHADFLDVTKASAILLEESYLERCPASALIVDKVDVAYAKLMELFVNSMQYAPGIHPTAIVDSDAEIAKDAFVGPYCVVGKAAKIGSGSVLTSHVYLGDGASLGENCFFHPRVTCYPGVQLADRVVLHSGVVIGSDGFGLINDAGKWLKVHQLGSVKIASNVEIGANTTIDRGTISDTVIAEGVKIDNQVHIAHNVTVGANTVIAGCTGVAGSVTIGKNCVIAGMVGIGDNLEIIDNTIITAQSGVAASILESGVYSSSVPVRPAAKWMRINSCFNRLDELFRRVRKLEKL